MGNIDGCNITFKTNNAPCLDLKEYNSLETYLFHPDTKKVYKKGRFIGYGEMLDNQVLAITLEQK